MGEVDRYIERVKVSRSALAALPEGGWPGEPGPPDEQTGDRWDRANVLGHVAEMLPFWTEQARRLMAGASQFGRGEDGYEQRRQGVQSGRQLGEEEVMRRIDRGIDELNALLAGMTDADLERRATYHASSGVREVELRYLVEELLVGHLETHLRQVQEITVRA